MMNDNDIPVVNVEYTEEKIDDELLLYSVDETQAVYLNDAAYAVWRLCKEEMTVGQMIVYLEEVYPEQKSQIRGDVISALNMLKENKVIELVNEGRE